jgi:AcrR family transcriptional regulator
MSAEVAKPAADVDDRIVAATLDVLRDRGYAGLSMEGVAAEAGVAKTTVYRRYRNRADLATAAMAATAPTPADRPAGEPARARLESFLRDFAHRFEELGLDVLGSILAEHDEDLLELHRQRVVWPRIEQAVALVQEGQARGEIRTDADPRLVLEMMVGSFFSRHVAGRELSGDEWARQVVATLWKGLEPPDGR